MTVTAGPVITTNPTDVTINAGHSLASGGGYTFTIGRDWNNAAGASGFTFGGNTPTVAFSPSQTTHTITGSTTFYNLTMDASSASAPVTLKIAGLSTQTIASGGTINLQGKAGQLLALTSTDSNLWTIDMVSAAAYTTSWLGISHGNTGTRDLAAANSHDGGNNNAVSPMCRRYRLPGRGPPASDAW